jgi:YegS/Rv2252/BmrU family lipid kinase
LNEVVNGVLQEDENPQVAVGVVPFGTANDFAAGCGVPTGDPLQALRLLGSDVARPMDVGKVNGRYFINVVSGGFGAEVTARTPVEMKRALGGAAYKLMGVVTAAKMSPYRATFTTADGTQHADILVITVANGRQCGGGIPVAPQALLDDGAMDILVVRDVALGEFGTLFSELANLEFKEGACVAHVRQSSFSLETDIPLQMNLDGEPMRDTSFRFETLARRLRFVLPDTAPMEAPPG